jgi:hypothetical protein
MHVRCERTMALALRPGSCFSVRSSPTKTVLELQRRLDRKLASDQHAAPCWPRHEGPTRMVHFPHETLLVGLKGISGGTVPSHLSAT